ncbi:flagellar biosynthetic protein FliR [Salmonella enterica subsp. enterica serovar Choleraesuis]|nr:flagellar biosynthetic protein FliR [Salmonella enterica subsp. enterica serovar Choleraesuis]
MDYRLTMLTLASDRWAAELSLYFWPFLRILALVASAPILSERSVPARVKVGLALVITFLVAPLIPASQTPLFSLDGLWLGLRQIVIGITIGFTMQLAFAAIRMAGEIIGLQMGLSFATFFDPASQLSMPVLARFLDLLAMLLFLSMDGHLWLISVLVDTFFSLPLTGGGLPASVFLALARAGSTVFLSGLMLALPLVTLLLTLNVALGLLNRMSPQLSVFVVGFPVTLTAGIMVMAALMPLVAPFAEHLFGELFDLIAQFTVMLKP